MDENKNTSDVLPLSVDNAVSVSSGKAGKPDRALIKAEKRLGKEEGAQYLKEKKACSTRDEAKAFRRKWKNRRKEWKAELKSLDAPQQAARRKGRKAFQHRIHRGRRIFRGAVAAILVLCLIAFGLPGAVTAFRIRSSQKYTNTGAEVEIARAAGYVLSDKIYEEGIVMLKNEEDFLPLEEKKLNLFGEDAYDQSSGSDSLTNALSAQGIACNPALARVYVHQDDGGILHKLKAKALSLLPGRVAEESGWLLPDSKVMGDAKAFSSQALILLSAETQNGKDLSLPSLQPMAAGTQKAAMIDAVCREFDHVILAVFSGNIMELNFLDNYDSIDAVLWLGEAGSSGYHTLAKVLTGTVNPSGRTADTWPCSLLSAPAAASRSSYYANLSGVETMDLSEGIYVGYRYYETRFGLEEDLYAKQVVFPFGHGLSFTTFSEELTSLTEENGILTAAIAVTNTGNTAGKNVVELYCRPPADAETGFERSSVTLVGFSKTAELAPGETADVTISFPLRALSCWSETEGCYILSAGDYSIVTGRNAHDALLSEDQEIYSVEEEILYRTDDVTGAQLLNRFVSAQGGMQTVSRTAWDETFPAPESSLIAPDALKQTFSSYGQTEEVLPPKSSAARAVSAPPKLDELKGLAYDDEQWDAFLNAFSAKELIRLAGNGAYHTEAVARLGVPSLRFLGGSSGLSSPNGKLNAVSYPSSAVMGASWNTDLAEQLGSSIAAEAAASGVSGWYAPNAGVHRTALDAGNADTFSEDPLLCGKMAAAEVKSAQYGGLISFVQGFVFGGSSALNSGVCLNVSEQALRELWLRPFEIAVKEGGAAGVSVSHARLGIEWCSASLPLLRSVLREEWGFCGIVSAVSPLSAWRAIALSIQNGTDLFFDEGLSCSEALLWLSYLRDEAATMQNLKSAVHDLCFTIVNTAM